MNRTFTLAVVAFVAMMVMGCTQPTDPPAPEPEPTYTVTYDLRSYQGTAPVDSAEYLEGDTVSVAASLEAITPDYSFLGWSLSVDGPIVTSFTMGAQDVTLFARWQYHYGSSYRYSRVSNQNTYSSVYLDSRNHHWYATVNDLDLGGNGETVIAKYFAFEGQTYVNSYYFDPPFVGLRMSTNHTVPTTRLFTDGTYSYWIAGHENGVDGVSLVILATNATGGVDELPFDVAIFESPYTFIP